jgi:hypothetical protein
MGSMLRHGFHPPEAQQHRSIPIALSVHSQVCTPFGGQTSAPIDRPYPYVKQKVAAIHRLDAVTRCESEVGHVPADIVAPHFIEDVFQPLVWQGSKGGPPFRSTTDRSAHRGWPGQAPAMMVRRAGEGLPTVNAITASRIVAVPG